VGTLFLVRHGQAAFGTADYDRLTAQGFEQSRVLGRYFAQRGIEFDAILTGTLRRHLETADAIVQSLAEVTVQTAAARESFSGLNEYDPRALLFALTGHEVVEDSAAQARDPIVVRQHFRLLREALLAWAEGRTQPVGMPDWQSFQAGAVHAVEWARERFADGTVLMVSSGGPIAAIVGASLSTPPATAVDLNLRIRNTAVTEFTTSAKRHHLVCFNSIAHIEMHTDPTLASYA
jgi:broad specificity phosphatase PhoE